MTEAERIARRYNANALVTMEDGHVVMLEHHSDPDERMYTMEYQSTPDGRHAIAWCRFNPWGGKNGGESYSEGHVDDEGCLCLGSKHFSTVEYSDYPLEVVIQRARYWCTAFSVLKETGTFPQPR